MTVLSQRIKKSKYSVRRIGISVSSVTLIRTVTFNQDLVGTGDRAMSSKQKAVSSTEGSLDILSEILQNFRAEIYSPGRNRQAGSCRRKILNLLFQSYFTQCYVDCVSKDIACVYCLENEKMQNNASCRKVESVLKKSGELFHTAIFKNENFILSADLMLQITFEYMTDYSDKKKARGKLEFIQPLAYLLRWLDSSKIMIYQKLCWPFYHLDLAYYLKIGLASISIQPSKFPTDFPFNKTKIDQPYKNILVTGGVKEFRVSGVNLIYDKSFKSNSETRVKNVLPEIGAEESFWYHGTRMESEENICSNGVRLSCGNEGKDFSKKGKGFYLAFNSDFAIEFAEAKLSGKHSGVKDMFAVLVFQVANDFRKKYKGIDLTDENELYLHATNYYRNYIHNSKLREPKALRGLMYIEGPTSAYDGAGRKLSNFHQLCIRHKKLSDDFFSKLCCILYFKKP